MPLTFAAILLLNSFKILLLFPNPLLLFSHYSQQMKIKNIVNACCSAAFTCNIVLQARGSKGCTWGTDKSESSDDNDKSTTLSMLWSMLALQLPVIFTTWSKPEVYLNHTLNFHTETLATILELFSILYRCYYSQNYSGIIISGLPPCVLGMGTTLHKPA